MEMPERPRNKDSNNKNAQLSRRDFLNLGAGSLAAAALGAAGVTAALSDDEKIETLPDDLLVTADVLRENIASQEAIFRSGVCVR